MAVKKKKQNIFQAYFSNFGIRQICDLSILVGAIVVIIGLFVSDLVIAVGLVIYIVACILAIVRGVLVLTSGINKRSPEYTGAMVNCIIMAVILAIAVFGLIYVLAF